jgi:hypothetical protein
LRPGREDRFDRAVPVEVALRQPAHVEDREEPGAGLEERDGGSGAADIDHQIETAVGPCQEQVREPVAGQIERCDSGHRRARSRRVEGLGTETVAGPQGDGDSVSGRVDPDHVEETVVVEIGHRYRHECGHGPVFEGREVQTGHPHRAGGDGPVQRNVFTQPGAKLLQDGHGASPRSEWTGHQLTSHCPNTENFS